MLPSAISSNYDNDTSRNWQRLQAKSQTITARRDRLKAEVRLLFEADGGRYGSPRITA
jgi:hypothetical protein